MTRGPHIALSLRLAYLALHRRTDQAMERFGITADQFVLMTALVRGDEALTQNELARRISSDPSTVRAMLVLLEKQGLIVREDHPIDARSRSVKLTAKGLRLHRQLWTASEPIRKRILSLFEPKEASLFLEFLHRFQAALTDRNTSDSSRHPLHDSGAKKWLHA